MTNPDKLFTAECNYTQFETVEVNYCDEDTTAWETRCDDVTDNVTNDIRNARANVCTGNLAIFRTAGSQTVAAGMSLFDDRCINLRDEVTAITTAQLTLCSGALDALMSAGGETADCRHADLSGAICGTGSAGASVAGSNPFAEICTESSGAALLDNFDAGIARVALALTCRTTNAANCSATITGISGGTSFRDCSLNPYLTTDNCHTNGAFMTEREARETLCTTSATSFDALCANIVTGISTDISTFSDALEIARGRGCLDSVAGATDCGNEDTSGDYIYAYCQSAGLTNLAECPNTYATMNATEVTDVSVPAIGTGENQLLNSDGSAALTVIASGEADDTNDDPTNFIELAADGTLLTTGTNYAGLTLTDTADGFAFANSATNKLYVGLLSGTGLGAPVNNADQGGTWDAKLRVISGGVLQAEQTFKLAVNFGGTSDTNTIGVTGTALDVTSLGVITINGKFTANGVIYGTVDFAGANTGTLTGLIGQSGAVGIFASDSGTAYVGGFVAAKAAAVFNCTADGIPFDLTNCPAAGDVRATICRTRSTATSLPTGFDAGTDCTTPTIQTAVCAASGDNANPFDTLICNTDQTANKLAFVNNCDQGNELGADCSNVMTCINNPFASGCDGAEYIGVNSRAVMLCSASDNPFDAKCAGYTEQVSQQQIYCADGNNAWQDRCDTHKGVTTVGNARAAACIADTAITTSNPGDAVVMIEKPLFDTVCDTLQIAGGETVLSARQTQCYNGTQLDALLCNTPQIEPVVCAASGKNANPFAAFCGDEAGTSTSSTIGSVINMVLNTCGTDSSKNSMAVCANSSTRRGTLGTTCIVGAPSDLFGGVCNYEFFNPVKVAYCGDDGTAWETRCKDDVTDLNDAIANARANVCIKDLAIIITAGAGDEVAAGMSLFSSRCNGLSVVGGTDTVAKARIALAEMCRVGTGAGCTQPADGASGKTVAECTKNPYDTTDSGTTTCFLNAAFNAERNDRATRLCNTADTSFDTLCDFVDVTTNVDTSASIFDIVRLARGTACADDTINTTSETCGNEGTQDSYLAAYCAASGGSPDAVNNLTYCPTAYATAHTNIDTVIASGLRGEALNSAGTGLATVIAAGGADNDNDDPTNFIDELGTDGTLLTEGANPSESPSGDTNRTGLTLAGGINGFAFARNNSNKLYVGLLASTNLGAPFRSENPETATWNAKLRVLFYNGSIYTPEEADFRLLISYGGRADNTLAIAGDDPSLTTLGAFSIVNGKFTNNGVIYGEVNFANNAGAGTLTGLIGDTGAVGIFKSNAKTVASPTSVAYVGGFIAAPADCTTAGDPFATDCNQVFDIVNVRGRLCIDNPNAADNTDSAGNCGDFVTGFCADTNYNFGENPFDAGCNNETDIIGTRITLCGTEGAHPNCMTIIANQCPPTGTRHEACPAGADFASWQRDAVGSDGETSLDVIAAGGANFANTKDSQAHFIVGGESALYLGNTPSLEQGDGGSLKLEGFDGIADDDAIGFAMAVGFFGTGSDGRTDRALRSFVGLLSGTNLGVPLPTTEPSATWNANMRILIGGNLATIVEASFKLNINFETTSFNIVGDQIRLANYTQDTSATFAITSGEFTEDGIIFGTTRLVAHSNITNRAGTLTGLIGEKGAVAVFASDTKETIAYVGGFVAAPDCTAAAGNPFSAACTDNLAQQKIFVNGCADTSITAGCDQPITAGGITIAECIANPYDFTCGERDGAIADVLAARNDICGYGGGTNPFDPLCNDNPSQDINQQSFCGESRLTDGSQKQMDCESVIAGLCAGSNSLFSNVGAGGYNCSADDEFASNREMECGTANLAEVPICRPIVAGLCTGAAAFESAVGAGNYPCSTNSAFEGARDAYCRTASNGDSRCTDRIARLCLAGDSPFSAICGADDATTHVVERGKACATGNMGSEFCGDEDTAGSYIFAYCDTAAGDTNAAYCPDAYAAANNTAVTVVSVGAFNISGENQPLNADGTGLETIIAFDGVNLAEDDRANFIAGSSETGLSLGSTVTSGGNNGGAMLASNRSNGYSFARGRDAKGLDYYYVGLWTTTNVGAPLRNADVTTTLEWTASMRSLIGTTDFRARSFTLLVELSDQTIRVKSGSLASGGLSFFIDGKFTDNGLLYGRVAHGSGVGTLTGLIGQRGAVGIFKSNSGVPYVGGFLANNDGGVNCTVNGTPFHADCTGNNDARVKLCSAWATTRLPNGVRVADVCAGDMDVTTVICADSGIYANPFDAAICTGDQDSTQTAFLDNCRLGSADGANCSRYTDCVANPYRTACDATYYATERTIYTESLLAYCSSDRTGVTAPVGAPDCATPEIQADVCVSSGTHANPLDAETCAGYANLEAIQSEFASACYDLRADLASNPQCNNIATCFASGKLGVASEVSTVGGIACNGAAFNDVVALSLCEGQTSGAATLTNNCLQETLTKACTANPFSVVVDNKGVNCLSDTTTVVSTVVSTDSDGRRTTLTTTLDDLREAFCINDSTKYNCTATITRVCMTGNNPFSDLCYDDNATYEQARYDTCSTISGEITPNAARTNDDTTLQNCLDTIDYECGYGGMEQFTNRFCLIGTLYDVARGRACLYGYDVSDGSGGTMNVKPDCTGGASYIAAYCATDDSGVATNLADCPDGYARLNPDASAVTVPAIGTGENQLLNSDGSAALSVIAANGAVDANDAPTNFIGITGGNAILATGTGTNRTGLMLADAVSGFAFANSDTSKLYVGLLSGTTLGAPLRTATSATWDANLSVLSYDGTTIGTPANKTFTLLVNYGGAGGNTLAVMGTAPTIGTLGAFTIAGKFTNNGVIYGSVAFADTNVGTGTLTGLIGDAGAVGIFKSDDKTVATATSIAYVGGFVASEPVAVTCNEDMPFSDMNCDAVTDAAARLAEANRCYNNGSLSGAQGGDCAAISVCLSSNGLFSSSNVSNNVLCSSAAFAGARANFCSRDNNIDSSACTNFIALNTNGEAACLTNPFADGCDTSLGASVVMTARAARVTYCVGQATTITTATNAPCTGALTYCSDSSRSGTSECASTAGTMVPLISAFCGVFRNLGNGVCDNSMERMTSCTNNPFDTFCDDDVYIMAQRDACGASDYALRLSNFDAQRRLVLVGDGRSTTEVNVAICASRGHTATICAEDEDANPFAMICTDTITDGTLTATQQGYCRADGLDRNPNDCGRVATTFCATAGTDTAIAFDNLCRDDRFDAARVKACGATPGLDLSSFANYDNCTDLVADLCPNNGDTRNVGCPLGDTVTAAHWISTLPGIGAVQADGTTQLTILSKLGLAEAYTGYVEADARGLKLGTDLLRDDGARKADVTYQGNILNLSDAGVAGDGGVAFARINFDGFTFNISTNKDRFYAGILDGTDLGAPLNSVEQSGTWSGKIALYAYGFVSSVVDFALTVTFNNGADGNLTADQTVDSTAFTIDGGFTSAGIIYGTTTFGPSNRQSTGSLTGLIGAKGAVGAFVSSGVGNSFSAPVRNRNGEYAGGFVVKASDPAAFVASDGAGYTAFKTHYAAQSGRRELIAEIKDALGTGRKFLQGTATGLVETGDIEFGLPDTPQPDTTHFESVAIKLGGNADSPDGFAVLSGRAGGAKFGVGLLSGTDLGAPLPTEAAAVVEWTGSLYYANSSTTTLTQATGDFTLIVDVNEGTLTTKTRVGIPVGQAGGTVRTIAIDGRFGERLDSEGNPSPGHLPVSILGGTVSLYTDGNKGSDEPLIGLIGTEGVLGVFTTGSLVGGFQAASLGVLPTGMKPVEVIDPPVDPTPGEVTGTTAYQAWANSFDAGNAQAVRGDTLRASNYTTPAGESADFIRLNDRNGNNDIVATNFDFANFPNANFSETLHLTGSTTSGVVYGQGLFNGSVQLYAGLLPTTNVADLGAPIAQDMAIALWTGSLAGYDLAGESIFTNNNAAFTLNVAFSGNSGTITSPSPTFIAGTNIFWGINFVGVFDENGVISGTANETFGSGITGTFNGLIGTKGAVGVFKGINPAGDKGYVGGFQVKPPSN